MYSISMRYVHLFYPAKNISKNISLIQGDILEINKESLRETNLTWGKSQEIRIREGVKGRGLSKAENLWKQNPNCLSDPPKSHLPISSSYVFNNILYRTKKQPLDLLEKAP
jgi:hypothetical protein